MSKPVLYLVNKTRVELDVPDEQETMDDSLILAHLSRTVPCGLIDSDPSSDQSCLMLSVWCGDGHVTFKENIPKIIFDEILGSWGFKTNLN